MERERAVLIPFSHFQPLEKHLDINRAINLCAQLVPGSNWKNVFASTNSNKIDISECTHIFLVFLLKEKLPLSNLQ